MIRILPLLAVALLAAPAAAQPHYRSQPDTLYYESLNPYHLYVIRGRDTLLDPVISFNVVRQVWRAADGGLEAEVREQAVDGGGKPTRHVLRLTPRGVVTQIDGGTDDARGPWNFVLRLPPDGELAPGRPWADTVAGPAGADGEPVLQTWRELRVERIADTLGSRMAVVRATGRVRYRDAYPYSAASGGTWWIDVAGPVEETFLFDTGAGRMAEWEWRMNLRGTAGLPAAGGGVDTFPAALRSRNTQRLVTADKGRLLLRGLPAGDTTITSTDTPGSTGFVHTARLTADTLHSGFTRPDGMLTTARAEYRDGRTVRYEMIATEPLQPPVLRTIRVLDGRLRVEGGGRDTVMPPPDLPWAVADYAMHEQLGPALARLARGGAEQAPLAVYRPYPMKWDTLEVTVRPLADDVLAAVLRHGDTLDVMFVDKDGTLLYGERLEPFATRRLPPEGSRRAKRVGELLEAAARLFQP